MIAWEKPISWFLARLRLDSIRRKILTFAFIATLVPSLTTAYISYVENKRALQAKAAEELLNVSAQTVRELDLWSKERRYDLRVFSLSSEVTDNLERLAGRSLGRITNYLNSVRERFVDYDELLVVDLSGRPVTSSAKAPRALALPAGWANDVRTAEWFHGAPYWDSTTGHPEMVIAVPIRVASGRLLGALAARVNLQPVGDTLRRFAPGGGQVYLMRDDGGVILNSNGPPADMMRQRYSSDAARWLLARDGKTAQFGSFTGERVVGGIRRVPALDWVVIAEIPSVEAFRQVAHLRNTTLLVVGALLAGIGALAYLLGLIIVRPLDRLTNGAALVAAGEMNVDLPVVTGGELGYLTTVFNVMVAALRDSRSELERLSATDPLTGLSNRRHMMDGLDAEVRRSRRLKHPFAVLMADVDNFKQFNDAHGHPAGDEVLKRLAKVLRDETRDVDLAARYGGEEFFVLMPETDAERASQVAERIRQTIAGEQFPGGSVRVSVGVAEFPVDGDGPEPLIAAADAALYDAKRDGRDRVALAGGRGAKRRSRAVSTDGGE